MALRFTVLLLTSGQVWDARIASDLLHYRGGAQSPPPSPPSHNSLMNPFIDNIQIEEQQMIDITWMTDEELAELLEVTVDQLLEE
jgi:hypothetical protein